MKIKSIMFLLLIPSVALAGMGKLDRSVTHHKTFALQNKFDFACLIGVGSGTLIDPYWILTANHVSGSKRDKSWNTTVCSSFDKNVDGKFINTKSITSYTDPNSSNGEYEFVYDKESRGYPFYDFSLVRLDKPIIGIKPAKLPTKNMFDTSGTYEVTQIGYGNYNGRNGGMKFVRYNPSTERWKTQYSYKPNMIPTSKLQWLTIHGDSGSAITIEKDGEHYVLGEVGQWATTDLGWADSFDDVITKLDWIKNTIKNNSFAYSEPMNMNDTDVYSVDNSTDAYAYINGKESSNLYFSNLDQLDEFNKIFKFYADEGEYYTIEATIGKNEKSPNFDVFVNGRHVAHNLSAKNENILVKVNKFKHSGDFITLEFKPTLPTEHSISINSVRVDN